MRPLVTWTEGRNRVEYQISLGKKVLLSWSKVRLRPLGDWAGQELGILCLVGLPSEVPSVSFSLSWCLLSAQLSSREGTPMPWMTELADCCHGSQETKKRNRREVAWGLLLKKGTSWVLWCPI